MASSASKFISNEVSNASFTYLTATEIRAISHKLVTECVTCHLHPLDCPGHYGHIELAIPSYNPVMFKILIKILHNCCLNCHTFKHGTTLINAYIQELETLYKGDVLKANTVREAHLLRRAASRKTRDNKVEVAEDILKEMKDRADLRAENESDDDNDSDDNDNKKKKNNKNDDDDDDEDAQMADIDIQYSQFLRKGGKVTHFEAIRREILRDFLSTASSHSMACTNCNAYSPAFRTADHARSKVFVMPLNAKHRSANEALEAKVNFSSVSEQSEHGTWFAPWEVHAHIKQLFKSERALIDLLFGTLRATGDNTFAKEASLESFFLTTIAVIPNKFRPANKVNGLLTEHGTNTHYKGILKANKQLSKQIESDTSDTKYMVNVVGELQYHLNNIFDSGYAAVFARGNAKVSNGIKQNIEKKAGLLRKNMMGKRVNFAARTVISPDISLESNEMGVPRIFAKKLTFPQPVTAFNYAQLAQAVINGSSAYPGANFIEDELGNLINLEKETPERRVALSKTLLTVRPQAPPGATKKVYRHLLTGDYVLANRQPTLHKPGISGHRVKVLGESEKTLRMHYCNCSTYNADFDGDEMNIHFPQSLIAAAEVREIAANNFQYLGPRAGVPLRGLIQDHILTGVLLTKRDTLFVKADFQRILYAACWAFNTSHPIRTPTPCVLKPVPLWSGKQLVSAALNHLTIGFLPLSLTGTSKIPAKLWGKHGEDIMRDSQVIFRDNEMLAGILEKNHFGASGGGLIHTIYELYNPHIAGQMLTVLGRMFTNYLSTRGFTAGLDDLLIKKPEEEFRVESLIKANAEGLQVAAKFAGQDKYDRVSTSRYMREALKEEREVGRLDSMLKKGLNQYTSKVIDTLLPGGQVKAFPENAFSLMTVSGAKGSVVNFSQISCLLGQQELEGKRVPRMVSGKTLPSFEPYDASARAGGFIMDRFLTGVRPQDYFFHCMAGREGLIDTAVKTSRSGYLQRCIIKHLEGLTVQYDNTVRDSDGSVIQFNFGEDSLEITKRQYLLNFDMIAQNFPLFKSHFTAELADMDRVWNSKATKDVLAYTEKLLATPVEKRGDPVMAKYNVCDFGVASDHFLQELNKYIEKNPLELIKTPKCKTGTISEKEFRQVMLLNYTRCLVSPGEVVGLLCAQSIGEPATQMTLNTFHLAGRGEANVTLGIPRLREIIQTAARQPTTPLMEFSLKDPANKAATELLAKRIEWLKMCDILESVVVHEQLRGVDRVYDVDLIFVPGLAEIFKVKDITTKQLSTIFESFVKQVQSSVRRASNTKALDVSDGQKPKSEYSAADDPHDGGDDDDDEKANNGDDEDNDNNNNDSSDKKKSKRKGREDDDDSSSVKQKGKKKQFVSYDDDEDEEDNDEDNGKDDIVNSEEDSDSDDRDKKKKKSSSSNDDSDNEDTSASGGSNGNDTSSKVSIDNGKKFDYSKFSFSVAVPSNSKKLLMVNIIEQVALKFIIKSFKGISRCFVNEKSVGGRTEYSVLTEGVNFGDVMTQLKDELQMDKIYTNHLYQILQTYGVEACKNAIVNEIKSVFGAYGITVDPRHLTLLADYMTFEGGYRACSRNGIENNTSPFQKMSFETSCTFLQKALLVGDNDNIESPSARIMVGQVVRGGTGAFKIVAPLS
uniref:DNA-directed RNA polymerase subunit n=1 Tax=Rostrostelium ellipticum TaxID=361140 RepID=A0A1L2FUU3_9MYCE|nr:RNA polymerase I [Rostrostelium ellipticum]